MIKVQHLVPGRVLLRSATKRVPVFDVNGRHFRDEWKETWKLCMVIAHVPDIKRRHSKSTAPVEGWEVLVIWMGEGKRTIEQVNIKPATSEWKMAW